MAPDIRTFFSRKDGSKPATTSSQTASSETKTSPAKMPAKSSTTPKKATPKAASKAAPKGRKKAKVESSDDEDIHEAEFVNGGDDYEESDSEDEVLLPPKKRGKAAAATPTKSRKVKKVVDEDDDMEDVTPRKIPHRSKRKSFEEEEEDDESEEEEEVKPKPAKRSRKPAEPKSAKSTPKKKEKKEPPAENAEIQAIYESIPLVRPPTPPPKEEGKKFDYRNMKQRDTGPINPGSKPIPQGADNCLAGLTFVFTGILQSLGREEGQDLVKRYGGKVMGAPSGKTSYVVLGDDAGPSKLEKIKKMSIKTINEDGLFALISRLPPSGGDSNAGADAAKKQKAEEEKMAKMAADMERREKEQQKAMQAAAAKKANSSPRKVPPAGPFVESRLITTKYAPSSADEIIGNKGNVENLQKWLHNWHHTNWNPKASNKWQQFRTVLLSGAPGVGKTTSAHLVAKLEGYDVIETNASDTRSKKLVTEGLTSTLDNTSLNGFFASEAKKVDKNKQKIVLIMDEVDGMSAGDRGGVAALAQMAKKTKVPIIMICNERKSPKMRPFDFNVWDITWRRPTTQEITSRIASICFREGLKMPKPVLESIIEGTRSDIRQILNMIADIKLDQQTISLDQTKDKSKAWQKHTVFKPWEIAGTFLAGGLYEAVNKKTLNDKIELYFNDFGLTPLMIQENYLKPRPVRANGADNYGYKLLELADQAAESISDGDLVDAMIHGSQQQWSLLPTHAVFSAVRPCSFMYGPLSGGTAFASFLGKNSTAGKNFRLVKEIQSHMRLRAPGNRHATRLDYLPLLWQKIVQPLNESKENVQQVIEFMDSYYLTRDDWQSITELGLGDIAEDQVKLDTQTKSSFTRTYNLQSHPMPFMKASNVAPQAKGAKKEKADFEDVIEESDAEDVMEDKQAQKAEEDENDVTKDKYVKEKKPKKAAATKAAPKKRKTKAAESSDDEDDEPPKKRAAPATRGRGRGRGRGKA